jgi:hypothetical protein
MSVNTLELTPSRKSVDRAASTGFTCPLGANCSCKFSGNRMDGAEVTATIAEPLPKKVRKRLATEVKSWTDLGWKVTTASAREVVLQRRRALSFCVNVLLCFATASLWLAYWIPNARNPKIDTRIVTVSESGEIVTSPAVSHRLYSIAPAS